MKITIYPVEGQMLRSRNLEDREFRGIECQNGWLIGVSPVGVEPTSMLWISGSFESLSSYSTPVVQFTGQTSIEIDTTQVEVSLDEKKAILKTVWHWEVWEPIILEGTCAIDSMERMLELPREVILNWFRDTGRNPSLLDDIVNTLRENEYEVEVAGPEGFGRFRDYRRLVLMFQKRNPNRGHVVLVYQNDEAVFDAAGVFKQVGDIVWSDTLGYNRGSVVKVEKG
jgi:hypothetical protein